MHKNEEFVTTFCSLTIFRTMYEHCFTRYNTWHFLCLCFLVFVGTNTALMAWSNTSFTPFCVFAEHSTYLTHSILLAIARPWLYNTADVRLSSCFPSAFDLVVFSRMSNLVPTNIVGTSAQWCLISGNHCEKIEKCCFFNSHFFFKTWRRYFFKV